MNAITKNLILRALQPSVASDVPGDLRLRFGLLKLLPADFAGHLHYFETGLELLPGVTKASLEPKDGSAQVLYDPAQTDKTRILAWYKAILEEGLACLEDPALKHASEQEVVETITERMQAHLSDL